MSYAAEIFIRFSAPILAPAKEIVGTPGDQFWNPSPTPNFTEQVFPPVPANCPSLSAVFRVSSIGFSRAAAQSSDQPS